MLVFTHTESMSSLKRWVKTLPHSRMVYPDSFSHRLKYFIWRLYTPLHPYIRDILLTFGILRHTGRQDFLIGTVAPNQTIKAVVSFLVEHGYGNNFIAWQDEGEIVSLRHIEDFVHQYHLRIFEDGEVRGHYEYTPECNPIMHLQEKHMQDRRQEFRQFLGDRVV